MWGHFFQFDKWNYVRNFLGWSNKELPHLHKICCGGFVVAFRHEAGAIFKQHHVNFESVLIIGIEKSIEWHSSN